MPKRQSKTRREARDANESAFDVVKRIVELTEGTPATNVVPMRRRKNTAAVALGRLGGLKRAQTVKQAIPEARRREIASIAARARWAKARGDG